MFLKSNRWHLEFLRTYSVGAPLSCSLQTSERCAWDVPAYWGHTSASLVYPDAWLAAAWPSADGMLLRQTGCGLQFRMPRAASESLSVQASARARRSASPPTATFVLESLLPL